MESEQEVWYHGIVLGWCDQAGCESVGHKANNCRLARTLDAALREAKAQAWEAMARRYDDLYEVADPACHIKMDDSRARELSIYRSEAKYCRHRAAALRSKQNAPAKKAKTAGTDHEFEWGGKWLGICGRCGGDHKPAAQPSAEPSRKED